MINGLTENTEMNKLIVKVKLYIYGKRTRHQ